MKTNMVHTSVCFENARRCSCLGNRRGAFFVLTAFMLPIIIWFVGLAVDYGSLTVSANQLQRSCNAAVIAAASKMVVSNSGAANKALAQPEAIKVLQMNFPGVQTADITVDPVTQTRVTVIANYKQKLPFASMGGLLPFQIFQSNIQRQATAERDPIIQVSDVCPIAITTTDLATYSAPGKLGKDFHLKLIDNQKDNFYAATGADAGTATNPTPILGLSEQDSNGDSPAKWQANLIDGTTATWKAAPRSINANTEGKQNPAFYAGMSTRVGQTVAITACPEVGQKNGISTHAMMSFALVKVVAVDGNGNITLQLLGSVPFSSENTKAANVNFGSTTETGASISRLVDDMNPQ